MINKKSDLELNLGDIADTVNRVEGIGKKSALGTAHSTVAEEEIDCENPIISKELEKFVDIFRNAKPLAVNERSVSSVIPRYQRDRLFNLSQWLRSNIGGKWTINEVQRVCIDYFFSAHPEVTVEIDRMRELRLKEEISATEAKLKELKDKKMKKMS